MLSTTLAGIDYSLTSPAITILDTKTNLHKSYFLTNSKKLAKTFNNLYFGSAHHSHISDIERYTHIAAWAVDVLVSNHVKHVALEGYSMGSHGRVFNIAENTAILKYFLHISNIQILLVSPSTVKKHATGKGNADKAAMISAYTTATGCDPAAVLGVCGSPVSDICDSYHLVDFLKSKIY